MISSPDRGNRFSIPQSVHAKPEAHSASYSVGTKISFIVGYLSDTGVMLDTYRHPVLKVNIPSLPHMPPICCTEAQALYTYTFWIRR
jgi:hypothetical protein